MTTRKWRATRDSYGRRWLHPSVTALLDEYGERDPSALIIRLARELADRSREMGWQGPPYDVRAVASLAGLRVPDPRPLPGDQSAMLLGTAIFTNADHAEVRQRYSTAHEIIHPLFPDRDCSLTFTRRGARDPDAEVEYLCQLGAAELLMPHWCFPGALMRLPFGLRAAFRLAEAYVVSPEAALRRLVDFAGRPAAAVFLRLGHRKTQAAKNAMPVLPGLEDAVPPIPPELRIRGRPQLSPEMKQRQVWIAHNKSIPPDSICYRALAERRAGRAGVHAATECWDIPKLGECRVETVAWLERNGQPAGGMCLLWQ